ncbi:type VI secretion system protein ImpL [Cupriavidus metallidurans]|jgi:type VI secretion system protein ImpL|nr:ImcF-related family protein [Cupriavidus metallidurans]MDE4916927.1 ImcF-related family protein [Cupriavidus metallidurans]
MENWKSWGYRIVVLAVAAALVSMAYFHGTGSEPAWKQMELVALIGLAAVLLRGPIAAAWKTVASRSNERKRHQRDPAARVGKGAGSKINLAALQYANLKLALREHRCRRLPRLLVTGNDAAVSRLLPELEEAGWFDTCDALLLSSKTSNEGQPDTAWLKRLYKLRRRRPVDAVIVVTDGAADLPMPRRGTHPYSIRLARIIEILRYAAPVYVVDVAGMDPTVSSDAPIIVCALPNQADASAIEEALLLLRNQLARRGLDQLTQEDRYPYQARLSQRFDTRSKALAKWTAGLIAGQIAVRGIAFAPYPSGTSTKPEMPGSADLPHWRYLSEAARRQPGKRIGWHPMTVCVGFALVAVGLWFAGMLASGWFNSRDVYAAQQAVTEIGSARNPATRLHALLALQQQIERYEYRTQQHAPLLTRFGLNRDADVLAALWQPYVKASRELLVTPVQQNLEATLVDLGQLQTTTLDDKTSQWALSGRDDLKAYLMLAYPERTEADFLAGRLPHDWSTEARITPGEKQALAERLFKFYAQHLKANPDWKIEPRPELVAGARQTLLAVIGARSAQETLYRGILNGAGNKYPDLTLPSLTAGTDARGLLRSAAAVPGVFTRQAYEGYVADAIDAAATRRDVAADWVLTGSQVAAVTATKSADELRAALTEQYFAEYAAHWQDFMNSLQWESAATLPAAIDQLKLLADARQSPAIALMKSLAYQGGAGVQKTSLSDTLVNKAKDILGKKDDAPNSAKAAPAGPLDAAFGPVLRLAGQPGQAGQGGNNDLSLQRYLDRITALRLRLQQVSIGADADDQARQMAQAMFQGKSSDLADTQAYAQLVAASLGAEWAGMGETLFVRPVAQATQAIVLPAQASLNDVWQRFIMAEWNRIFAGRYPFANTTNDASLPELAQFLRPQGGTIQTFLATQLAGVLELQGDQWMPAAGARGITFDPEFLKTINILQRIGAHMLVQGDPQYRFELKPIATPGLTDTKLTIDGQKLHYYNQRETWNRMTWPASNLQDPGTLLQWQTEKAGTNKNYEYGGRFALLRMIGHGHIVPIDSATVQITWPAVPDTRGPLEESTDAQSGKAPYEIRFLMRSEAGQGVLELLPLRGLKLPQRVFLVGKGGAAVDVPSPAARNAKRGGV